MDVLDFDEIYKQYYRKSCLFVKSIVRDNLIVEDIVSESLLYLWETAQKTQVVSPLGLLFIILKNKSLNHLKCQQAMKQAMTNLLQYEIDDINYRINTLQALELSNIFSTEISNIIEKTLSTLPERTKLIFQMSRYQNMIVKDIATKLNITPKGVEYHITISLNRLRFTLKEYLPFFLFFIFK